MEFCRIEKSAVAVIGCNEAMNVELLKRLFCNNDYVYVETASHCLNGIISVGDFRNKFDIRNHINTSFRFLLDGENVLDEAKEIYEKTGVREIPVLNVKRKLLYVMRKKQDIINSFAFDWKLCDVTYMQDFFKTAHNVYYFDESDKISELKSFASSFMEIKQIDSVERCKTENMLIHNGYAADIVNSYPINEIYLSVLSRSTVKYLREKEVRYYFFQSPVAEKLRKENKIFTKAIRICGIKKN